MENIINNIKDPSWWFTAFFVAIIASVIAGFLKERIANLIGGFSSNLSEWREKRKKEEEIIIEALINNEAYFNIALFRVVVTHISFAISVVIYCTYPVYVSLVPHDKEPFFSFDRGFFIWKIFQPLLGFLTSLIAFKVSSRTTLVYKAIRKYRVKHNLPKLP